MSSHHLEESVADKTRPAKYVEGLTDFLTDESYKRIGIYTTDPKELFAFWKDYVSAVYREMREFKLQKKKADNSLFGMDFGAAPGVPEATFGNEYKNGSTTIKVGKGASPAVCAKPPVKLPKDNFKTRYDKYSNLYEYDVSYTIEQDIVQMKDKKKQDDLRTENEMRNK